MFTKFTKILLAVMVIAAVTKGQKVTIEGLSARSFSGVKSINGQYYYTFYFGEKTENKGMANFVLALYDADLNPVKTAEIEISKDSRLAGSSFNGQYFLFRFSDLVRNKRTTITMDKDGNVIKNDVEEKVRAALLVADNDPDVHALNESEFLIISPEREKKFGYEVSIVDKDLNVKWANSFFPDKGSWSIEDTRIVGDKLYLLRREKPSLIGDKYTYAVQGIKLTDGAEVYTTELKDEDDGGFPNFINVNNEGVVATGGMYFKKGKYDEKNSDGLFFALIDQDGKITKMSKTSWKEVKDEIKGDFSSALVGGKTKVLVEDIIRKDDGTYIVVAETFRKSAADETGAGALTKLGGMSSSKGSADGDKGFTVMDFAFFNFDANGTLTGIDKVEKETKEAIIKGSLADKNGLELAQELYKRKFFSYRTTMMVDGKQYIMYKNLDGFKTKAYFLPVGSTSTNGAGSIDMDKWMSEGLNKVGKVAKWTGQSMKAEFGSEEFGTPKNTELYKNVIPAKPGYVLIYNFFNGKMDIWLEPIPKS